MNRLIFLLVPIFLITIAGCGGGGGGGSSSGDGGGDGGGATTSGDVTVAWVSPSDNVDGSALTITGFKIYFGQVSGNYNDPDSPLDIVCTASCGCNIGVACTYTVNEALLGAGDWCFVITAYDSIPNESAYSNEVCN